MKITVELPLMLSLGRSRSPKVDAKTIREALRNLNAEYPGIADQFFDERDRLRPLIVIAHGDEILSHDADLDRKVFAGDTITILQAIAGG